MFDLTVERQNFFPCRSIQTKEDWWANCNGIWDDILQLFELCGAELASKIWPDDVGKPLTTHTESLEDFLTRLKTDQDGIELSRYFNLAWMAAPDAKHIHSWPNWGNFCDLCSENWVFQDEE